MSAQPTIVEPHEPRLANTRLRGRWLLLARVFWLVVALLSVGICSVALLNIYANNQSVADALDFPELASRFIAVYYVGINTVFAVVSVAIAAVIFWHRSDDRMALLVSIALLVSLVTGVLSGFFPAWRAARMNPVDALRNE